MGLYNQKVKPLLDLVTAAILVLILAPFAVILYFMGLFAFSKPIFKQIRVGKGEKEFTMYKFKSLRVDGDESTIPMWGKVLRFTSLDELPQLINILKGEMSFIGPRPLLTDYLQHYSEAQKKRHLVKPGITGLAQVKGRNKLAWKESLALDTYYAENCSFGLDMSILLKTIPQLLKFSEVDENKGVSRGAFNKVEP